MRLYRRKDTGYFYVEFYRGKHRSLRTKDEKKARAVYRELEKEWLRGRLIQLDHGKRITLAEFTREYLGSRHSLSPATVAKDELSLRLLADVVGGNTALKAVKTKKIDQFKKACLARGCKAVTVNGYLRHIKAAFSVAEDWYRGYERPKIKMCKLGERLPRALAPRQIDKLLASAVKDWPQLYPLLVFYLWTGVRRKEALRLQWQDVHLDTDPHARIIGKGNKERIVPLLPPVIEILHPLKKDIGSVFIQVHADTITHWFKKLVRECQIEARLHDLRHSAATYMLNSGTRLEVVQAIMGHTSIETTRIYTKVLKRTLHKEMRLEFE
jgi:site-specific recombinase XerD